MVFIGRTMTNANFFRVAPWMEVGNFLHFWSLARQETKFQISCETCKTARLEEFPIFSFIFKFLGRHSLMAGLRRLISFLEEKKPLPPVFESKCPFYIYIIFTHIICKRIHQGSPGVTKMGSLGFPWVPLGSLGFPCFLKNGLKSCKTLVPSFPSFFFENKSPLLSPKPC